MDNLEFVKHEELKRDFPELTKNQRMLIIKEFIQDLLSQFDIAKTPSYIDIDYEDIEDSQVLASAKAIGAAVVIRDQRMLNKYPDWCLSAANLLHQIDEVNESRHLSKVLYTFSKVNIHFLSEISFHPLQCKRKVLTTLGLK